MVVVIFFSLVPCYRHLLRDLASPMSACPPLSFLLVLPLLLPLSISHPSMLHSLLLPLLPFLLMVLLLPLPLLLHPFMLLPLPLHLLLQVFLALQPSLY